MGLGAPKRRNKLSQDPNNTQWSKSTATYGHKILSAQGWKPGDYLGAENASHSDYYTGANASHIRVLLREDNLGLGAQVGKVNAETFGLSLFSGVLGRLNGKSDVEVQKHQSALRDAELRNYQTQKYGHMNFVSGGFLIGDQIESSQDGGRLPLRQETQNDSEAVSDTGSKSKKREGGAEATDRSNKKRKKEASKKRPNVSGLGDPQVPEVVAEPVKESNVQTKSQTRAKADQRAHAVDEDEDVTNEDERSRRKQDRRTRKEERRRRKEEKHTAVSSDKPSKAKSTRDRSSANVAKNPGTTRNTDMFASSRHAVRQRYIQQKRMASLDPQAMKEIFMLKPTATAA